MVVFGLGERADLVGKGEGGGKVLEFIDAFELGNTGALDDMPFGNEGQEFAQFVGRGVG